MTTYNELLEMFVTNGPGNKQQSFTRKDLIEFAESIGVKRQVAVRALKNCRRVSRGVYTMALQADNDDQKTSNVVEMPERKVQSTTNDEVYIPERNKQFVPWGFFKDVEKIIKTKMFYPMYISGLSGNGKTLMVEQACSKTKREYVRVQITPETDEDDLIGGFRLVGGETVFAKGPVIKAMEAGAILLIDEIDRGSNKLMALQGVLEGKPVLIKKTGEVVQAAPGFNVIATANTKGQGDEAGRFIAASIIDEAFLERFTVTLDQPYPTERIERKIINNHMIKYNVEDNGFAEKLVKWAQAIRKTFDDGGVEDTISTRRLCHIVQTYAIFNNRKKSIELCVNRFDADTREAFVSLYEKIDGEVSEEDAALYTPDNQEV